MLPSAVYVPALENCVKATASVSNVNDPDDGTVSVVHTKPLSPLAVPSSTNTKALLSSAAVLASATLVQLPPSTTK